MDSSPDFSSWPPVLQWLAGLGAVVAGAIAWVVGTRDKKPSPETAFIDQFRKIVEENSEATADAAAARAREHAKLELRIVLNEELGELRQETQKALSDNRRMIYERLDRISNDQQALRERVARLEATMNRRRQ